MDKVGFQKQVVVVSAAIGMLCTFLPWAKVPIVGSVSGTEGDGWITLLLFAVPLVLALRGDKLTAFTKKESYIAAAAAAIAGVIGIWKIADVNSVKDSLGDDAFGAMFSSSVSVGFGLYLLVISSVAVVVGSLFVKNKESVPTAKTTKVVEK